ncbi:MAG: nodulation protein NfeD [Nitrospira sp.]|nr:nodulation protein NfeD [Nitrospira sp.]MCP9464038.1 nodulation protein NfeD [Nitrospira sp.]
MCSCQPRRWFPIKYAAAFVGRVALGSAALLLLLSNAQAREVLVATYEGVINPVAAEYFHDALAAAQSSSAQAVILQLDTPGGLDTSMRLIVKDITGSPIPVIVFVAPSGGRAASAGVFITMAAHIAAMAPGTNIGAAHPVAIGGGEMDKTMKEKVENDAVAYLKSIAEQRGRNVAWAEDAVRKSVSATEQEALKLKIIDLVADDLTTLLKQLHGRTVLVAGGPITLTTEGALVREFPMGLRLELLKALSDPNIAYLLMTVGTIGILAELYNPGAILPGIVGAISLILAFYSLQSLPVNYAGVLLFLLGIVFFILEATVTSYGLLAIGGVVSMMLGSLMLIKSDAEFFQISWSVIIPVIAATAAISLFVVGMGVRALRRSPLTGSEGMIGAVGVAKTALRPDGKLMIHGELWDAVSDSPVEEGGTAKVLRVEGLKLYVTPVFQKKEA